MKVTDTEIGGLKIIEPKVFPDHRGHFFEGFNERTFLGKSLTHRFVQDNQSKSNYGVVRGLHYQLPPFAQCKLVRVLSGRVLDVVLDIRTTSPTFGQSFSIELSEENNLQLLIPAGLAHGFVTLSETAVFFYKCDQFYSKEHEAGIYCLDEELDIDWGIAKDELILSDKDRDLPDFIDALYFQ